METRCPNCNSTDCIVEGDRLECFNCDKFSYVDEPVSQFELTLNELRHKPVFVDFDGRGPKLFILMKDDHMNLWQAGTQRLSTPVDNCFRTEQVTDIEENEDDLYPTIFVDTVREVV